MSQFLFNPQINPMIPREQYNFKEFWVPITYLTVEGVKPYYYISTFGRIFSTNRNTFMTTNINKQGYLRTTLMTNMGHKLYLIHRLMMLTFCYIPNHQELVVNHKDGIKYNNFIWNLEWCTSEYNTNHAKHMGLLKPNNRPNSTGEMIDVETAHKICKMLECQKYSNRDIAIKIGCDVSVVNHISAGDSWTDISCKYNIQHRQSNKFTNIEYYKVCEYLKIYAEDSISKAQLIKDTLYHALDGKEYNKSNYDVVNYIIKTKKYLND